MIDRVEAMEIAKRYLSETFGEGEGACRLVEDSVDERPGAWVLPYDTRASLEAGDDFASLVGDGPLVVAKHDGRLWSELGGADPELALRDLERDQGWEVPPAGRELAQRLVSSFVEERVLEREGDYPDDFDFDEVPEVEAERDDAWVLRCAEGTFVLDKSTLEISELTQS